MADVKPLKLEFDSDGTPSGIGEFKTGDTIETAIVDLSMSGLTDVSSTILPSDGDVLVYNGSLWTAASSDGLPSAGGLPDSSSIDYVYVDDGGVFKKIALSAMFNTLYGFSSIDVSENKFFLQRKDGATYENLIRATDGTITLQAEDDIHLRSNTGEDFARFNENAAVWLYHNDVKKIETHILGAVVTGSLSATSDLSVSGNIYGAGNVGVIGQIMCGQTGSGTADLNVVDDNSNATVEINSGANYDSLIQFRENNAWRCDMGWDGGDNDFILKTHTGDINLQPHTGYTVSANCSSITVSSCPIPPPWSFVQVTDNDGSSVATPQYFASGSSQSKSERGEPNHITWDSTNSYFTITNAGYYELEMQGSFLVGTSPTEVTMSIITTAGFGGVESAKITKVQTIRTNMDPHDGIVKWMGYLGAGIKVTCKIDGNNACQTRTGSTFSCKRIN